MKLNGIKKLTLFSLIGLNLAACQNISPVTPEQNENSFNIQSLTPGYLDRKISTLIGNTDARGLVKEIAYGMNKHPDTLTDIFLDEPSLYDLMVNFPEVQDRRAISAPFDTFIASLKPPHAGYIFNFAGNGSQGYGGDGGPATEATINQPFGLTVDAQGNFYISDTYNSLIRKIDKVTGKVSTIAGKLLDYSFSGDDGQAKDATMSRQTGLIFDNDRNLLYIADTFNARIRKINMATGVITTVAGNGTQAYSGDGDQATKASINNVYGIDLDREGNLYLADRFNHRIRKVNTRTGIITTIAGNGVQSFGGDNRPATEASLNNPAHTVHDRQGNMYISDASNGRIRKVDAMTGIITTIAGGGLGTTEGGKATDAVLGLLGGMALDEKRNLLYVGEYINSKVRKIDLNTGNIFTFAGNGSPGYTGENGPATSASFRFPLGGTLDKRGDLYIIDSSNNRIRKVIRDY
jgi:sugar lactone lactonase YvrE